METQTSPTPANPLIPVNRTPINKTKIEELVLPLLVLLEEWDAARAVRPVWLVALVAKFSTVSSSTIRFDAFRTGLA